MASPPFSIAETVPGDSDFIRLYPAVERAFRDIVESWIGFEHDATTGRHKIPVNSTVNLAALSYATGSVRYDTTDATFQVTATAGSTWNIVSIVPGNQFLIRNTAATAPRGWTKITLGANYAIVGSDSTPAVIDGGTTGFTTVFAGRTILQANLPNVNFTVSGSTTSDGNHNHTSNTDPAGSHSHGPQAGFSSFAGGNSGEGGNVVGASSADFPAFNSTSTVGDHSHFLTTSINGAHTHSISGNAASGGSGTAMDFSVLRIGFTLCEKANPS